jgi:hypothetical protein
MAEEIIKKHRYRSCDILEKRLKIIGKRAVKYFEYDNKNYKTLDEAWDAVNKWWSS